MPHTPSRHPLHPSRGTGRGGGIRQSRHDAPMPPPSTRVGWQPLGNETTGRLYKAVHSENGPVEVKDDAHPVSWMEQQVNELRAQSHHILENAPPIIPTGYAAVAGGVRYSEEKGRSPLRSPSTSTLPPDVILSPAPFRDIPSVRRSSRSLRPEPCHPETHPNVGSAMAEHRAAEGSFKRTSPVEQLRQNMAAISPPHFRRGQRSPILRDAASGPSSPEPPPRQPSPLAMAYPPQPPSAPVPPPPIAGMVSETPRAAHPVAIPAAVSVPRWGHSCVIPVAFNPPGVSVPFLPATPMHGHPVEQQPQHHRPQQQYQQQQQHQQQGDLQAMFDRLGSTITRELQRGLSGLSPCNSARADNSIRELSPRGDLNEVGTSERGQRSCLSHFSEDIIHPISSPLRRRSPTPTHTPIPPPMPTNRRALAPISTPAPHMVLPATPTLRGSPEPVWVGNMVVHTAVPVEPDIHRHVSPRRKEPVAVIVPPPPPPETGLVSPLRARPGTPPIIVGIADECRLISPWRKSPPVDFIVEPPPEPLLVSPIRKGQSRMMSPEPIPDTPLTSPPRQREVLQPLPPLPEEAPPPLPPQPPPPPPKEAPSPAATAPAPPPQPPKEAHRAPPPKPKAAQPPAVHQPPKDVTAEPPPKPPPTPSEDSFDVVPICVSTPRAPPPTPPNEVWEVPPEILVALAGACAAWTRAKPPTKMESEPSELQSTRVTQLVGPPSNTRGPQQGFEEASEEGDIDELAEILRLKRRIAELERRPETSESGVQTYTAEHLSNECQTEAPEEVVTAEYGVQVAAEQQEVGVQEAPEMKQSEGQTDPPLTRHFVAQTEAVSLQHHLVQTDTAPVGVFGVQTDTMATWESGMQTEPPMLTHDAMQTEPPNLLHAPTQTETVEPQYVEVQTDIPEPPQTTSVQTDIVEPPQVTAVQTDPPDVMCGVSQTDPPTPQLVSSTQTEAPPTTWHFGVQTEPPERGSEMVQTETPRVEHGMMQTEQKPLQHFHAQTDPIPQPKPPESISSPTQTDAVRAEAGATQTETIRVVCSPTQWERQDDWYNDVKCQAEAEMRDVSNQMSFEMHSVSVQGSFSTPSCTPPSLPPFVPSTVAAHATQTSDIASAPSTEVMDRSTGALTMPFLVNASSQTVPPPQLYDRGTNAVATMVNSCSQYDIPAYHAPPPLDLEVASVGVTASPQQTTAATGMTPKQPPLLETRQTTHISPREAQTREDLPPPHHPAPPPEAPPQPPQQPPQPPQYPSHPYPSYPLPPQQQSDDDESLSLDHSFTWNADIEVPVHHHRPEMVVEVMPPPEPHPPPQRILISPRRQRVEPMVSPRAEPLISPRRQHVEVYPLTSPRRQVGEVPDAVPLVSPLRDRPDPPERLLTSPWRQRSAVGMTSDGDPPLVSPWRDDPTNLTRAAAIAQEAREAREALAAAIASPATSPRRLVVTEYITPSSPPRQPPVEMVAVAHPTGDHRGGEAWCLVPSPSKRTVSSPRRQPRGGAAWCLVEEPLPTQSPPRAEAVPRRVDLPVRSPRMSPERELSPSTVCSVSTASHGSPPSHPNKWAEWWAVKKAEAEAGSALERMVSLTTDPAALQRRMAELGSAGHYHSHPPHRLATAEAVPLHPHMSAPHTRGHLVANPLRSKSDDHSHRVEVAADYRTHGDSDTAERLAEGWEVSGVHGQGGLLLHRGGGESGGGYPPATTRRASPPQDKMSPPFPPLPALTWDRHLSRGVRISANGKEATCVGRHQGFIMVGTAAVDPLLGSANSWTVALRLNRPCTRDILVGLTAKGSRGGPTYFYRGDGCKIAEHGDGNQHGARYGVSLGGTAGRPTLVTCHMDMSHRTIAFEVNREYLGVAFTLPSNIAAPLYPMVVLGDTGDSATIQ